MEETEDEYERNGTFYLYELQMELLFLGMGGQIQGSFPKQHQLLQDK